MSSSADCSASEHAFSASSSSFSGSDGRSCDRDGCEMEEGDVVSILKSDGRVTKKLVKAGDGKLTPEKPDLVTISSTGAVVDGAVFDTTDHATLLLSRSSAFPGTLQRAIMTMTRGEEAVFTLTADHGYGSEGNAAKGVPPNAMLQYTVSLHDFRSVEEIAADGSVLKLEVTKASGYETPQAHYPLKIHVVTKTPAGTVLGDTRRDGGAPLDIILSKTSNVPKPLTKAIKSLKKGEVAEIRALRPNISSLFCPIPDEESEIWYEIEMVDWEEVIKLTKDGGVMMRRVGEKGDGYEMPEEGAVAHVRYVVRTAAGEVVDRRGDENTPFTFCVGSGDVPDALDLAVAKMRGGERALVECRPTYASGPAGSPPVLTGEETLTAELELVSYEQAKKAWNMNVDERLAAATARKEEGTKLYQRDQWKHAVKKYDKAMDLVKVSKEKENDDMKNATSAQLAAARTLRLSCLLNLALCHTRLEKYTVARRVLNEALDIDSKNTKALFRRAKVHALLRDPEEAEADLKRLLDIEPGNKEARKLLAEVVAAGAEVKKAQKSFYSKMFS